MDIEIENFSDGKTEKETWEFRLFTDTRLKMWLIRYRKQYKLPKQRTWRTAQYWNMYIKRENTLHEPPLPEAVVLEAKTRFKQAIDGLRIEIWVGG